jgi:hypothetical protein
MRDPETRMRLLVGIGAMYAMLFAFTIGVVVFSHVIGTASDADAGVRSTAVSSALSHAIFPSLCVGALTGYLYRPMSRDRRPIRAVWRTRSLFGRG